MAWNFVQHLPGENALTPRQKLLMLYTVSILTHRYELPDGMSMRELRRRVSGDVRAVAAQYEAVSSAVWMIQTLYRCLCHGEPVYRLETGSRGKHDRPVLRRTLAAVLARRPLTWADLVGDTREREELLARGLPPPSLQDKDDWSAANLEAMHRKLRMPATLPLNDRRRKPEDAAGSDMVLVAANDVFFKTRDGLRSNLIEVFERADVRGLTATCLLVRVDTALTHSLACLTRHPADTIQVRRKVRMLMDDIRRTKRLIADTQNRNGNALAAVIAVRQELQSAGLLEKRTAQ